MPTVNGQFVDKSQLGQASVSTQTNTAGNSGGLFGGDSEKLKKLMGLYAIAKGNPSEAWNILKPEGETAEAKNRKISLKPATIAISKAKTQKYEGTGPQAIPSLLSIKFLGGLGAKQSMVSQNQNFELLKQSVVRALQGARMSDTDIEMAAGYIPSIKDTPDTIKTKLDNLDSFIQSMTGETLTNQSTSSMLRVKQKSTGQTGTIPASEFDPNLYEKI